MPKRPITVLDAHIANRIAAGEVIERPASAVKELIENSLDAGARRVEVEIRGGGKEYIRVTDDGEGIPPAEVPLAFERHATSKIAAADDLFAVATLGFRGEALPSIAAVAEVELRTRTGESLEGIRYAIVAGRPQATEPVGAPVGTTVIVRRLFFNTPARYKFLRTDATEKRYVADVVARLSLARPDVAFRLLADGRELLSTPGDGKLSSAVLAVYGPQLSRELVPVALNAEGIGVQGVVGKPGLHHGNRERISIILNGRWIHSSALCRAVEKGYDTLLPPRRFPVAVLHLTVDPRSVDVNVHPAKAEVRFRDDGTVFRIVLRAVRHGLLDANLIGSLAPVPLGPTASPGTVQGAFPAAPAGALPFAAVPEGAEPLPAARAALSPGLAAFPVLGDEEPYPAAPGAGVGQVRETGAGLAAAAGSWRAPLPTPPGDGAAADPSAADPATAGGQELSPDNEDARRELREMAVLGQLHRTYIVGETRAGLWIVDQHVAHERVLYERFMQAAAEGRADVQQLLVPVTITLPPAQAGLVEQFQAELERVGLVLEPFGGRTYRVRGVPVPLAGAGARDIQRLVEDIVTLCAGEGAWQPHGVCAQMACKAAVKAGQLLEERQMRQLLVDLSRAENPFACPHGRPIVMSIPSALLARRFGRH